MHYSDFLSSPLTVQYIAINNVAGILWSFTAVWSVYAGNTIVYQYYG